MRQQPRPRPLGLKGAGQLGCSSAEAPVPAALTLSEGRCERRARIQPVKQPSEEFMFVLVDWRR